MKIVVMIKQQFIRTVPVLACAFVMMYCGYVAVFGSSGIMALSGYEQQARTLQGQLDAVRAEREALQSNVVRLRPETLDWDLVEQEAQRKLGHAAPNRQSLPM